MPGYVGVRCPVCNKKFMSTDDIVVCPVCGAPHHRACYAQKNECAFAAEHMSGKEWRAPHDPQEEHAASAKACPSCGANNPQESIFCAICGAHLDLDAPPRQGGYARRSIPGQPGAHRQVESIPLNEPIGGQPAGDIAAYVGENAAYFLPRFKIFAEGGGKISLNLAALLFNYYYFFYRKMYLVGAFLFGVFLVCFVPSFLYSIAYLPVTIKELGWADILLANGWNIPAQVDWAAVERYALWSRIARMIQFSVGFIASFYANRLYYDKVIPAVAHIREKYADDRQLDYRLREAGGVSRALVIGLIATVLVGYGILCMIAGVIVLGA